MCHRPGPTDVDQSDHIISNGSQLIQAFHNTVFIQTWTDMNFKLAFLLKMNKTSLISL